MQAICPIALILRSPNVYVKPILHINTEDVAVTRQIVDAGKLLDVDVLDHLIIGRQRFVSLKERGLGFD
jgi:DNA repair protein RadC